MTMKKLFLTLVIFTLLLSPCFAAEATNKRQLKDETLIRGIINSPSGRLSKHYISFREDYFLYNKNHDKSSIYYSIIELEEKYNKKKAENAEVNLEYITKAKDLYEFLVKYPSEKSMTSEFIKEFDAKKIIIPDNLYEKLDEDLVNYITLINVYK